MLRPICRHKRIRTGIERHRKENNRINRIANKSRSSRRNPLRIKGDQDV